MSFNVVDFNDCGPKGICGCDTSNPQKVYDLVQPCVSGSNFDEENCFCSGQPGVWRYTAVASGDTTGAWTTYVEIDPPVTDPDTGERRQTVIVQEQLYIPPEDLVFPTEPTSVQGPISVCPDDSGGRSQNLLRRHTAISQEYCDSCNCTGVGLAAGRCFVSRLNLDRNCTDGTYRFLQPGIVGVDCDGNRYTTVDLDLTYIGEGSVYDYVDGSCLSQDNRYDFIYYFNC